MSSRSSASIALVVLFGIFVLAGCSGGNKRSVLKGTVSYQGKPLTSGIVHFHMADKRTAMATIHPDGSFEATDVLPGEAKVTIEEGLSPRKMPVPPNVRMPGSSRPSPSAPVTIPSKYRDVKTTPLVYTLQPNTPLNIELQ